MAGNPMLPVIPDNIPPFLLQLPLWCTWIPEFQGLQGTFPLSPLTGRTPTNEAEWGRVGQTLAAYQRGWGVGLAVLLRHQDHCVGINIGGAVGEDGLLVPWAESIVRQVPAYWERSPRRAVRGFLRGTLPEDCTRSRSIGGGMVEICCEGILSVSGHRLPGSALGVPQCPEELAWLISFVSTRAEPADQSANFERSGVGEVGACSSALRKYRDDKAAIPSGDVISTPAPTASDPAAHPPIEEVVNTSLRSKPEPGDASPPPIPLLAAAANWQEPRFIMLLLPAVERLDADWLLPAPFVPYVHQITRDLQIRVDAPATALMGCFSGAVMRRASIRPKQNSDWVVHPIFWTILVLPSGALKSPCLNAALRPLEELQEEAIREYLIEKEIYQRERSQNPDEERSAPTCRRFITNEVTFAAIQQLLVENQAGLLLARDELPGFLNTLAMKDRAMDKQFLLESWPGTRSFTVDRIGRGMIHAPKIAIAILGGIQPTIMQRVVTASVERGDFADGFLPRFQLAIWPDESAEYTYFDEPGDPEAYQRVLAVFRRAIETGNDAPREYRFDHDAQARFEEYLQRLEFRIRRGITDNIIKEHLSKFRSLMPAMAVLIHVAEDPDANEIPGHRARRAELWAEYLESHARRVYACVTGGPRHPTQVLADRIKAGALGTTFTVRQVYNHNWAGLTTPEAVRAALQELEGAGWVRRVPSTPGSQGGRPSEIYEVNPRVYRP
jgi:hypothetical protein